MTESAVVLTVIRYLGRLSVLLAAGAVVLTWRVVDQAGKVGQVDPVAVGAVAAIVGLTSAVIATIGALLVSTRSGPTPDAPPTPVTVENTPEEPVQTEVVS